MLGVYCLAMQGRVPVGPFSLQTQAACLAPCKVLVPAVTAAVASPPMGSLFERVRVCVFAFLRSVLHGLCCVLVLAGNSCSWWTVLTEPLDLLAVIWGGQVVDKCMPPNQKHTVWQVLLQVRCCPVQQPGCEAMGRLGSERVEPAVSKQSCASRGQGFGICGRAVVSMLSLSMRCGCLGRWRGLHAVPFSSSGAGTPC